MRWCITEFHIFCCWGTTIHFFLLQVTAIITDGSKIGGICLLVELAQRRVCYQMGSSSNYLTCVLPVEPLKKVTSNFDWMWFFLVLPKSKKTKIPYLVQLTFWENVHPSPCVICHVSHVSFHVSCVTCHLSHVTCHVSAVTCHLLFLFFF